MSVFFETLNWILRRDGAFASFFLPAEIADNERCRSYVMRRMRDLIKHRVQQGKIHDHVRVLGICPSFCNYIYGNMFRGNLKRLKRH